MNKGPLFKHKFLCIQKLRRDDKKKACKGARVLSWQISTTPLKTDLKYLRHVRLFFRQLEPEEEENRVGVGYTLFKQAKSLSDLSIGNIANEQGLSELFKALPRLTKLTSLEIKEEDMSYSLKDQVLLRIHKILKLFPKLEAFTFFGINPDMKQETIEKMFRIFEKMQNLSRIHLEIFLNSQNIQSVLPKLCSFISTSPRISLQLKLKFDGDCTSEDFAKTCRLLTGFRQLKELTVGCFCIDTSCQEFIQFFETNSQLEIFSLEGELKDGAPLAIPFSKLLNLRKLRCCFSKPGGKNQEHFAILTEGISGCKNLKELSLDFSQCLNLGNQPTSGFQTLFAGLPSLKILILNFKFWIFSFSDYLSEATADSLSKAIPLLSGLKELNISFAGCNRIGDQSAQLLFESISQLSNLKKLQLNFCETILTDAAFENLALTLERLQEIEYCYFQFDRCRKIKGQFVKPVADLILQKKDRFKRCYLSFHFWDISLNVEELNKIKLEIKQNCPTVSFSLFSFSEK